MTEEKTLWMMMPITSTRMVQMLMAMHFEEDAKSIIPIKPMVYLTVPVKMKKGTSVRLG